MAKVKKQRGAIAETLVTVIWAVGLAFILRTFLYQPFHIPSGSMQPGLVKGDYIITSKFSVGYGRFAADPLPFPIKDGRLFERAPKRGDVLVFKPDGERKSFIKRLIGLPGDQVQMISGLLYINGERVAIERVGDEIRRDRFGNDDETEVWRESLSNGTNYRIYDDQKNSPTDNTGVFTVPEGYYFLMGDNRDHSADSRVTVSRNGAGFVPAENIIGKAEIVLLSVNDDFALLKPWTWLNFRGNRFFKRIE